MERTEIEEENRQLRKLLWLHHGCDGLYGDDGEMQCAACMLDFKRDSIEKLQKVFYDKVKVPRELNPHACPVCGGFMLYTGVGSRICERCGYK